jgi:NAD-dependent dihydropyrimidine dehydrogenase PreA subunit
VVARTYNAGRIRVNPLSERELALMTYIITDPCIGTKDRSCVDVCPVDCIHDDGDEDRILYIDPDECIDCGACEPACPVNAIFAEDDTPDAAKAFMEINALWYKDKAAARAKVDEAVPA